MSSEMARPQKTTETQQTNELMIAEFNAIRAEILKRIEQRYQMFSLALLAPGTLLAFSLQAKNPAVALLYPPFAYALAVAWSDSERSIRQLAEYIRKRIEARLGYPGWETTVLVNHKHQGILSRWLAYQSARITFLGTQLLTIIVGTTLSKPIGSIVTIGSLAVPDYGGLVDGLLLLGVISVLVTAFFLRRLPILALPAYAPEG